LVKRRVFFMAKIVIALGGNALGNTPYEQIELIKETAKPIVDLISEGNEVIIAHGNGPQVGMINLGMSTAAEAGAIKSDMPFPECGAMSQGYIGYHLQNAISNEFVKRGINKTVVTVVTQVLVDESDPAFANPSKPVGAFYTKEQADKIAAERGYTMVEDAGRGYRQVVPSPRPIDVIEKDAVNNLIAAGNVVITVGGGGIPVVRRNGELYGVPAVIDKDFASAKLAELVKADMLIILTAVDRVAINFGKPNQESLEHMTVADAEQYCKEGHFAPGSMLPKVKAAISFAEKGGVAIIASLEKAALAIKGESGTKVTLN
jgi:carbamate kinase